MTENLFLKIASEWGLSIGILICVVIYLVKNYSAQIGGLQKSFDDLHDACQSLKTSVDENVRQLKELRTSARDAEERLEDNKNETLENRRAIHDLKDSIPLFKKIDTQEMDSRFDRLENKIDKLLEKNNVR